MAEKYEHLSPKHIAFIQAQHLFFVATAGAEGHVNLSPKGMDSFRVLNPQEVIWLNLTGSGNETAAHLLENPRMTIMFCSFDKQPLILRLYGDAEAIHPRDPAWDDLIHTFPEDPGARQIYRVKLQLVQTSCGYAVPYYTYQDDRPTLRKWAQNRGQEGIEQYWADKNAISLDGKDTGILEDA